MKISVPDWVAVAAREAANRIERSSNHSRNPRPTAVYQTSNGWYIQDASQTAPKDGQLALTVKPTVEVPRSPPRRPTEWWE